MKFIPLLMLLSTTVFGQYVDDFTRRGMYMSNPNENKPIPNKLLSFSSLAGSQRSEAIRQITSSFLTVEDIGMIPHHYTPRSWGEGFDNRSVASSNGLVFINYCVTPEFNGKITKMDLGHDGTPAYQVTFPFTNAVVGSIIQGYAGFATLADYGHGKQIRQYRFLQTNTPSLTDIQAHLDKGKSLTVYLDDSSKCTACKGFRKKLSTRPKQDEETCSVCKGSGTVVTRHQVTLQK